MAFPDRLIEWRIARLTRRIERVQAKLQRLLAFRDRLAMRVKQLRLALDNRRGLRVLRGLRRR